MMSKRRYRWWYVWAPVAALGLLMAVVAAGGHRLYSSSTHGAETPPLPNPSNAKLRVETANPTKGGISLRTSQPGTAHSWESAELYSKVSGFLLDQQVDIGTHVKRGDVLARIDCPELAKDVESAAASAEQAKAEVAQAEAQVASAIADHKAAMSRVAQVMADADRYVAEVSFNQKQFDRISALSGLNGIEQRVVDEKQLQLDAAQANQRAAQNTILATEQQAAAAESRVALAKADLEVARAKLKVAQSQLDRANVMASYLTITSPYDGVVTMRNFHRGAYIRSPDQGGQIPLLAVDCVDRMRILVRVPEREVPYIQAGDRATVRFDALPQREFVGKVARIAESEDPATRTMLAEIDLSNPDHVIRDQMYGRVEIALEEAPHGVTVPSSSLVGDVVDGQGQLYVADAGVARLRKVQVGRDTGVLAEVLSGLETSEPVIVRPPAGVSDGTPISTVASAATK